MLITLEQNDRFANFVANVKCEVFLGHAVLLFILAAKRVVSWRWSHRKTASTPLSLSPLVRTTLTRPFTMVCAYALETKLAAYYMICSPT